MVGAVFALAGDLVAIEMVATQRGRAGARFSRS